MGSNKSVKDIIMRLTKGSIMRTPEPSGPHNGYATGVLLYRKGSKWYYSLTSPHDETGEIIMDQETINKARLSVEKMVAVGR